MPGGVTKNVYKFGYAGRMDHEFQVHTRRCNTAATHAMPAHRRRISGDGKFSVAVSNDDIQDASRRLASTGGGAFTFIGPPPLSESIGVGLRPRREIPSALYVAWNH